MILDRGYICLEVTEIFKDWSKKNSNNQVLNFDECEPTIYLIEDDFLDDDLVIIKYFEEIFMYELESTGIHESLWPSITIEVFQAFFSVKVGVSVIDLKSK